MNGNSAVLKAQEKWLRLMARYEVTDDLALNTFRFLAQAYQAENRVYHTLYHVLQVLEVVILLAPYARDEGAVQLAAWFHDAIYDPTANNNEERSAKAAVDALTHLRFTNTLVSEVRRLIELTATHRADPNDSNGHVLLDADLAILGAPADVYAAYARAIRQEYEWLDDNAYRRGRIRVLRHFLQRDYIYYTPQQRAELEWQARHNLRAEIESLA